MYSGLLVTRMFERTSGTELRSARNDRKNYNNHHYTNLGNCGSIRRLECRYGVSVRQFKVCTEGSRTDH